MGSWVLKGGYANQLRAPAEARFTQDVDLRIDAPLDQAQTILATAASTDLSDLFSYELGAPKPLIGPPGGGLRFPVQTLIAGSAFVSFGADVNSKDAVVGKLERHPSDPIVVKLGSPQSHFPVYPIAQQFAEELHAFTRPRDQENTRVRDLADMIWFMERYTFASDVRISRPGKRPSNAAASTRGRRPSRRSRTLGPGPTPCCARRWGSFPGRLVPPGMRLRGSSSRSWRADEVCGPEGAAAGRRAADG